MGPQQQRLLDLGVPIDRPEPWPGLDPGQTGYIAAFPAAPGHRFVLLLHPDAPENYAEMFAEWALGLIDRIGNLGPEADGWFKRSDGGWQMWASLKHLPEW